MGILDRLGLTNRGRTQNARNTVAEFMTTLAGADCHGVPPLSIYQRFNSVGIDEHGACAVAQGACGYRFGGDIKVDFAKLLPVPSPLTASGKVKMSAARLPTSAILIYRLPTALTAVDLAGSPIALAMLDGINWTFDAGVTVTVGAKTEAFNKLAALDLTLNAGANYKYYSTKIVSFGTKHYNRETMGDAYAEADKMLGVEIKKTLTNILAHHEEESTKQAKAKGLEVGKTSLKELAKEKKKDLTSLGKGVYRDLRRGVGYEYLVSGFAVGAAVGVAGKLAYDAYQDYKDSKLDTQMHQLRMALTDKYHQLPPADKNGDKGRTLRKAMNRITELRNAFLEERIFGGTSAPDIGAVPKVTSAHLERTDETALMLTSHEYGGELQGTAKLKISKLEGEAKKTADLQGQKIDFRFQVRGANNMMLIQDTHANFMQMTRETAYKAKLALTGVKALDKDFEKKSKPKKKTTPGGPKIFDDRRFGALRYRSASVYLMNDGQSKRRAVPGVSGISMGVSVRASRLISYGHMVEGFVKGTRKPDTDTKDFEDWVCLHLGCKPEHLRKFIKSTLLPDSEIGEDGKTSFPTDALILEANYGLEASDLVEMTMNANGEPPDLFDHMSFSTAQGFQNDVAAGKRKLSSMRLRYRIQTPLKSTAKTFFTLGMPLEESLPISANIEFGSNKEVGQESIADLSVWYAPEILAASETEEEAADSSVPPVVLFNRC
ncbi:MAG: hypothetical protein AAGD04_14795 [Pseudomonadota bacterium]